MTNQWLMARPMIKGNSVNIIMLIRLSVVHTKRKNFKEDYTPKTSTMPLIW
jgi:hypothetical protein